MANGNDGPASAWTDWFSVVVAGGILVGFMYVFGSAFNDARSDQSREPDTVTSDTPAQENKTPEADPKKRTQLATILVGVVTSVVAAAFGVALDNRAAARSARLERAGRFVARFASPDKQKIVAVAYSIVYLLFGVIAVYFWLRPADPPEEVSTLALTIIGFAAAVVKSRF